MMTHVRRVELPATVRVHCATCERAMTVPVPTEPGLFFCPACEAVATLHFAEFE